MVFRHRAFIAAILFLLFVTAGIVGQKRPAPRSSPAQPSRAAEDREGIEALQKRDIAAAMGFDVDRMLELWTDDAVLLPPRHEPVVGKAALRRFLEEKKEQYSNYDMLGYNADWNEVMTAGNYAFQWGTVSIRLKPPTGAEIGGAAHMLRVLKREEDGTWLIARAIWNEASATK